MAGYPPLPIGWGEGWGEGHSTLFLFPNVLNSYANSFHGRLMFSACLRTSGSSADLQSAVSQICNLQTVESFRARSQHHACRMQFRDTAPKAFREHRLQICDTSLVQQLIRLQ